MILPPESCIIELIKLHLNHAQSLDGKLCKNIETMSNSCVYSHIAWHIVSAQLINQLSYLIRTLLKIILLGNNSYHEVQTKYTLISN